MSPLTMRVRLTVAQRVVAPDGRMDRGEPTIASLIATPAFTRKRGE